MAILGSCIVLLGNGGLVLQSADFLRKSIKLSLDPVECTGVPRGAPWCTSSIAASWGAIERRDGCKHTGQRWCLPGLADGSERKAHTARTTQRREQSIMRVCTIDLGQ